MDAAYSHAIGWFADGRIAMRNKEALLDGQDEWLDALDRRSEAWTFKVEEGESVDLKAVLEVDARAPDGVEASAPRDRGDRADR